MLRIQTHDLMFKSKIKTVSASIQLVSIVKGAEKDHMHGEVKGRCYRYSFAYY